MNRRSFFKVIGAATAAAAMPIKLLAAEGPITSGFVLGGLTEYVWFDLPRMTWMVAHTYTGVDGSMWHCVHMSAADKREDLPMSRLREASRKGIQTALRKRNTGDKVKWTAKAT